MKTSNQSFPAHPTIAHGFTLLELLIALTLSAIIMVTLSLGSNIVLRDWERSSTRLDDSLDQILVLLQIERALDGAFPHTYQDEDENKPIVIFNGEADQIMWVSTVSPGRQPGFTVWQITPHEESTGGAEIRIIPAYGGNPTERLEEIEEPILAFEGYEVLFEYLYKDEQFDDKETEWLEKWSGKDRQSLPNAVRLHLEPIGELTEVPLEIIATIKAYEHQSLPPIRVP